MEIAYSEEKRILLAGTRNQSQHFNLKQVKRREKNALENGAFFMIF